MPTKTLPFKAKLTTKPLTASQTADRYKMSAAEIDKLVRALRKADPLGAMAVRHRLGAGKFSSKASLSAADKNSKKGRKRRVKQVFHKRTAASE